MVTDDQMRAMRAVGELGTWRSRLFSVALVLSIGGALAVMWALHSAGWVSTGGRTSDLQVGWIIALPVLVGVLFARLLRRWYTPLLRRRVARKYGVDPNRLGLGVSDLFGR